MITNDDDGGDGAPKRQSIVKARTGLLEETAVEPLCGGSALVLVRCGELVWRDFNMSGWYWEAAVK